MSISRQKHQPIALADILADQDQINPDLDSQVPNLDRMHIHIDMPDTRYLPAHRPDSLPSTCSGGPQTTAAYQDMTPFTTSISSFNFPATADATLLTPVSNAGSPPMHQRPKDFMRAYHPSQPSSNAQQPTPPNTSTGIYYPGYDMSSSSQSSSPLTVHPHATEFTMTPYMRHSPSHMNGHPSPKDDALPPFNHYTGHFAVSGVSGNCNESEVSNAYRDYPDLNQVDQVDSFLPRGMAPHMITTSSQHTPILSHADPGQYHHGMQMTRRAGQIEDLRDPNIPMMGHPGQTTYQPRAAAPTRRGGKRVTKPSSQSKRPGSRPLAQGSLRAIEATGLDNDADSIEEGPEAVRLDDKADEESKFIFNTRRSLVKSGMKGKGMWEEISKKYEEAYGQRLEKATLQMRLTRAFAKYAIWPLKEIERLKEAFEAIEAKRYKLILDHMKEIGGAQCWSWTPQLLEMKLIDLGLEEPNVDEKTNIRKRRRNARRRRAAQTQQNPALLHGGDHWVPLGLHPGSMQAPMQHDQEDSEDNMIPQYTSEQRNNYIEEVMSKSFKPEQEDSSPEPDVMDVQYHRTEDNRDRPQHQNTRVAKQAVEQLMMNGMPM